MSTLLALLQFLAAGRVPPCWFKTMTGLPCPSCGGTRAVLALLTGDPLRAVWFNPGVMIGGTLFAGYLIWGGWHNYSTGAWPRGPRVPGLRRLLIAAVLLNWGWVLLAGV